jgi:hypothetical protein
MEAASFNRTTHLLSCSSQLEASLLELIFSLIKPHRDLCSEKRLPAATGIWPMAFHYPQQTDSSPLDQKTHLLKVLNYFSTSRISWKTVKSYWNREEPNARQKIEQMEISNKLTTQLPLLQAQATQTMKEARAETKYKPKETWKYIIAFSVSSVSLKKMITTNMVLEVFSTYKT